MKIRKHITRFFPLALLGFLIRGAIAQESIVWAKNFPATTSYSQSPTGLTTDSDGNAYLLYGKGVPAGQVGDWHLSKIGPSGNIIFDKIIAASNSAVAYVPTTNPAIKFSTGSANSQARITAIFTQYPASQSISTILVEQFDLSGIPLFSNPVQVLAPVGSDFSAGAFDVAADGTVYVAYGNGASLYFDTISNQGVAQPYVTTGSGLAVTGVHHLHDGDWLIQANTAWQVLSGQTGQLRFSSPSSSSQTPVHLGLLLPNDEILSVANSQTLTSPRTLTHAATISFERWNGNGIHICACRLER